MSNAKSIKAGDIFWVDDFPPLDGTTSGRHPVIVIDLEDDDPVVVVVVTTDRSDPDRVDLVTQEDEPSAMTGLPQRCCAMPRWTVNIERRRLLEHERAGRLPRVTLEQLAEAVDRILSELPPAPEPPPEAESQ